MHQKDASEVFSKVSIKHQASAPSCSWAKPAHTCMRRGRAIPSHAASSTLSEAASPLTAFDLKQGVHQAKDKPLSPRHKSSTHLPLARAFVWMTLFLKFLICTQCRFQGQLQLEFLFRASRTNGKCVVYTHTPPNSQNPHKQHLKSLGRAGAREGHIRLPLCKASPQVHCHLPTSVRPCMCASKGELSRGGRV